MVQVTLVDESGAKQPHSVKLTPREEQVVRLVVDLKSVKQIARELEISPHTVRGYLEELSRKIPGKEPRQKRILLWGTKNLSIAA